MPNRQKPTKSLQERIRDLQCECSGIEFYDIIAEMEACYLIHWGSKAGEETVHNMVMPIKALKKFFITLDQDFPFKPQKE